jgi:hypothetical protein
VIPSRSTVTDNEAAGSLMWLEVGYPHSLLDGGPAHLKIYASCIVEVSYVFNQSNSSNVGKATINTQRRMQINKDNRPVLKPSYTFRLCMAVIREIVSSNKLFTNSPTKITCYKQI